MDIHTRQKEDRTRIEALTMEAISLRESMEQSEFAAAAKASTLASRVEEEALKRIEVENAQKETQAKLRPSENSSCSTLKFKHRDGKMRVLPT